MKLIRTLVFCFLFALVVAIYLYQARLNKQALTILPDEVNRTFVLEPKDIPVRIEIWDPSANSDIVLKRKESEWTLTAPVSYPADPEIVQGLVVGLHVASQRTRLRAEKGWEEYGLAKPDLEVEVEMPEGKNEKLLLGNRVQVGRGVFAKWGSERGYFLLQEEIKEAFRQSIYGLREKHIFRTPAAEINKVFVEMGGNSYQWKKDGSPAKQDEARPSSQGGEIWYWLEPIAKFGQKIQPERMGQVLAALQNLYIKEFLDDNKKTKAELGFFMIHDRISIESDSGKTETFVFGNELGTQNAYYGLRENDPVVFLVDRGKIFQLLDLLKILAGDGGGQKAEGAKTITGSSPAPQADGILHAVS